MRKETIMKGKLKKNVIKLGTGMDKYSLKMSALLQALLCPGRPTAIDLINPKNLCFSQSNISVGTCDLWILAAHITRSSISSVTKKSRQELQSSSFLFLQDNNVKKKICR